MRQTHCRFFSGYKPCGKNPICSEDCSFKSIPNTRILIISLEAMGAVLRSTVILEPLKKKYPESHITWITEPSALGLLQNNPLIDRLTSVPNLLDLEALEFDIAYVVDKSLRAQGILSRIKTKSVYGFRADKRSGAILPASLAAKELWEIGLSNQKKFFENKKPETQLLIEALELGPFERSPYVLKLSPQEQREAVKRKNLWNGTPLIGINMGASNVIPYKKWTKEFQRELCQALPFQIVLLGGPDEKPMAEFISNGLEHVHVSPLENGVRDGVISLSACDLIVSGDSLGMHLGIALKKYVIAWFGPTCEQEIDLYDRGQKLLSAAPCSPCWKRHCEQPLMCYDQVALKDVIAAIYKGLECQTYLSKPLFSETSFSQSL